MTTNYTVYIGTYTDPILFGTGKILDGKGEGIYVYRMDSVSGAMEFITTISGTTNPSYLAFNADCSHLYAVNELKSYQDEPTGTVSAFAVDSKTGQLTFLNKKPTHGTDPCHLTVDKTGKHVLLANFMSGSVCVLPIQADGSLGDASDFIQHRGAGIDPARQQGPHAHAVTLDDANRYAFVPDLGLDKTLIYRFDAESGKLAPNEAPWVAVKPGAGPRHLVFHPKGRYAYLINELNSTVTVYGYDRDNGKLDDIQTISTLPDDYRGSSTCADLQVSPSGEFLYGSNRGHDSIVIYKIDRSTGRLSCIGHESTRGNTPRNFAIDPAGNFLLAANQDSDTIVTFHIDSKSGELHPTGQVTEVPTPVCVKIMLLPILTLRLT
jgi:6-phosphogluconolactonase